ncbi:hypothetical protein LJ655_05195 [Paraburkholderia sp. MMS20-SJTN17]|uniref:Uncharacterized protein n=1 Tax=Paraburkholderia translucens TaxID=2886945 RepID=A0ABS8K9F5_9BURK|nr:hypothetical protein [Paraburkholderia sp. MMS20-SJTN17]MCC8401297.1 hypothetical protein [Paraburkholderia sp. MMS20-SJTN17]
MKHPTVHTTAPTPGVSATARWDEESFTVFCEVNCPPLPSPPEPQASLSDVLDARFGIGAPAYVMTAGTLSMHLDQQRRLAGLDFYTNPERWTVRIAEQFTDPANRTPHIETQFDEHGHAQDIGAPEVFYEPRHGILDLSWGSVTHWYGIAPTLAIGIDDHKRLTRIRLYGLTIARQHSQSAHIQ